MTLKSVTSLGILNKVMMEYNIFVLLLLLTTSLAADDAVKNHRAEKRQDSDYLFFGGWRPVKSGSQPYQASATGHYHDLLSVLPGKVDNSARFYAHALPAASNYYKDIYNYYPRPAIKNTPKKNTPVYMERFKPRRQQQKHGGRVSISSGAPQYIDIQKLELKHLRDLQNILLQAKELPLTQLSLPNGGKPYEVVELALQPYQTQNNNKGSRNRYSRNRGSQGNNKGSSYRRVPQNITPAQLPLQFQYVTVPHIKAMPQILPKQISVAPVKLPHPVPNVEDIFKNFQVVEVPLPVSLSSEKIGGSSSYGQRNNEYSQQQYRIPTPKAPQKVSFPANTYYAHNAEQPRKQYPAPTSAKSNYDLQQQHQIEAELFKLSDEEVQELLKSLQTVKKNSQEFLKILPLADASHKTKQEQMHLVLTLPQGNLEQHIDTQGYESQNQEGNGNYGTKEQYVAVPQDVAYPPHGSASISYNSGGYQINSQSQGVEHSASGYQIDEQGRNPYEQYQTLDGKAGYIQKSYEETRPTKQEETTYAQAGYDAPTQQGAQNHQEQYLEVIAPPPSSNGYRREPVLAVEIQKGQTIEDAIKSIDPETLQRLGAHGKNGLEIEVVEVPVDEYSSESKKSETYVSNSTSTTKALSKNTTTVAPILKEKSKTTEKKS